MARLTEYNYKGISVIYGLYTDEEGIRYIGHSKDVHRRFRHHLNNNHETNNHKKNWIDKNKDKIKLKILSSDHIDWEVEEQKQIIKYDNLLNICKGGKNNIHSVDFDKKTNKDHINDINKALAELNRFLGYKRFKKFVYNG